MRSCCCRQEKVVVVSGYFAPCHAGHVEYFALAKQLAGQGGKVVVIVNNDLQATNKRGVCAVPLADRLAIVGAMRYVDEAVASIDEGRSVCTTLAMLCQRPDHSGGARPTHFVNSGDRASAEVPEKPVCDFHGVVMQDLPAPKLNSSSDMIRHIVDNTHLLKW
jgi:cytidyltransferase-like protein